jgi:hypothetical protein
LLYGGTVRSVHILYRSPGTWLVDECRFVGGVTARRASHVFSCGK